MFDHRHSAKLPARMLLSAIRCRNHGTETLSKSLFGASYRLEVCCAVRSSDVITLTSFISRLDNPPRLSSIAKELQTLEASGLLIREPSVPGMRSVYLRAVVSPFWDACRDLASSSSNHRPSKAAPMEVQP